MTALRLCPDCRGIIDPATNVCQNCGGGAEWGEEEDQEEFDEWFSVVDLRNYELEMEEEDD